MYVQAASTKSQRTGGNGCRTFARAKVGDEEGDTDGEAETEKRGIEQ